MPVLDSGWLTFSLSCIAAILLGCRIYIQRIVRPRKGLPIPPGPSGHWLFGTPFPKSRAPYKLAELTNKYGPVISLRHRSRLFVIIGRYQAAMEIMEKEGASLADRPPMIAAGEVLSGGMRVFTTRSGDRLRKIRRVLHAVMKPQVAGTYEPIQFRHAKNLLLDILDAPEAHQMHARRFAASVVMEITYGKDTPISYSDPEVVAINRCLVRVARAMGPGTYLVDTFPFLRHVPGYLTELRMWHEEELTLFQGQLNTVRKQMAEDVARPCVAQFLVDHQRTYGLDDKQMAYLAGSLFGAGTETTASAVTIMMMAAALHQDAQARVYEELDRVVGRERLPSFADKEMLPQVTAFILETSRWRPVSITGVPHLATKDIIWRGYVIPEGATVIGNLWGIAKDVEVFPNPDKFDPQRWLTTEGTVRDDVRFYTFGYGRRACPAEHIANRSNFISIAFILWAFRISEDPKAPINPLAFSDTVTQIADPFRLVFEPRSSVSQLRDMCTQ